MHRYPDDEPRPGTDGGEAAPDLPDSHETSLPTQAADPSSQPYGDIASAVAPRGDADPEVIDRYCVIGKVGEGGMGSVFLAEQSEPVRRRVALKVIKMGMDTEEVIARFEAERQALALMSHSGIAKVLDAGSTHDGRPYFAMEYVEGVPITRFCDENRLTIRQRLRLFVQVCQAIHHAHQKGIIHRDLKPSNILVTREEGEAIPKVIDFGIAKATSERLIEDSVETRIGVLVGTPAYMSPEQAEVGAIDIDTTTDVYALGVVLYELLVGGLPFSAEELHGGGYDEMRRVIREVEPDRLSRRASKLDGRAGKVAELRCSDPRSLRRELAGDLDWIVGKAMDKERSRRYASVAAFADDIVRFLDHQPIEARPPTAGYRLGRLVRRHRGAVAAAVAVLVALGAGLVASTLLYLRSEEQRAIAEAINAFLNDDLLAAVSPEQQGREVTMLEVLNTAAANVDGKFPGQPLVEAGIRHTLGVAYTELGALEAAEIQLQAALDLRAAELDDAHADVLKSAYSLAVTKKERDDLEGAATLYERTLATQRRVLGPEHRDTLTTMGALANVIYARGEIEEALALQQEVVDIERRVLGDQHTDTLIALNNLANTHRALGDYEAAAEIEEEVIEARTRIDGPEHPSTLLAMSNHSLTLRRLGRYQDAYELNERLLEIRQRVLGPEHFETLRTMGNLALTARDLGDVAGARDRFEELLSLHRTALGPTHSDTMYTMGQLATTYRMLGDREAARALQESTVDLQVETLGREHPRTLETMHGLANTLSDLGDHEGAQALQEQVVELRTRVLGPDHPDTLSTMGNLANTYSNQGELEAARDLKRQVMDSRIRAQGRDDEGTLFAMDSLALTLSELGELEEARTLQQEVLDGRRRIFGEDHTDTLLTMTQLGATLRRTGEFAASRELIERAVAGLERAVDAEHVYMTFALWELAQTTRDAGDEDAAIVMSRLCWLVDADEAALHSYQRTVRGEIASSCS